MHPRSDVRTAAETLASRNSLKGACPLRFADPRSISTRKSTVFEGCTFCFRLSLHVFSLNGIRQVGLSALLGPRAWLDHLIQTSRGAKRMLALFLPCCDDILDRCATPPARVDAQVEALHVPQQQRRVSTGNLTDANTTVVSSFTISAAIRQRAVCLRPAGSVLRYILV
jgi:hypothetical protein